MPLVPISEVPSKRPVQEVKRNNGFSISSVRRGVPLEHRAISGFSNAFVGFAKGKDQTPSEKKAEVVRDATHVAEHLVKHAGNTEEGKIATDVALNSLERLATKAIDKIEKKQGQ